MNQKRRFAMRFLAAWALASAADEPCAFAVVRLPETSARDARTRDTGYEFLEPETVNREPSTAQRLAVAYAYDPIGNRTSATEYDETSGQGIRYACHITGIF